MLPSGQTLEIVQANIAELAVDAVVNPTNANFYMGGMVGEYAFIIIEMKRWVNCIH